MTLVEAGFAFIFTLAQTRGQSAERRGGRSPPPGVPYGHALRHRARRLAPSHVGRSPLGAPPRHLTAPLERPPVGPGGFGSGGSSCSRSAGPSASWPASQHAARRTIAKTPRATG